MTTTIAISTTPSEAGGECFGAVQFRPTCPMAMTEMNPYLATALRAMRAGISVLPPRQNGSKRPIGAWKNYQTERADEETIREWYANGCTGVGVVPGAVSGGLELFEFDEPSMAQRFIAEAERAGMRDLVKQIVAGYCELTPGGGVHWFWRCSEVGGNTKLARRPKRPEEMEDEHDTIKVLIETRGEGGYAIVAPSNGAVHPSGGAYELISGGWESVATITPEEREALFDLARSFDEIPRPPAPQHFDSTNRVSVGDRPGDRWAAQTDWRAILEPAGWQFVFERDGVSYWRRPGKSWGISASTNYGGSDLLYVFSTSTVFEPEQSYTKFGAYTILNHGGDYAAASRTLLEQQPGGVLVRHERTIQEIVDEETGEVQERQRRFEIIDGPDFLQRPPQRWMFRHRIPEQSFVCILGQPGSYKTFLALDLGLAKATGRPFLEQPTTPGNVLYIAAEGVGGFSKRMRAWAYHHTAIPPSFKILPSTVAITDTKAVADLILDVRSFGEPFDLIILDTLSRSMPGANENDSKDMTAAVAAAEALQRELGCTVVVLHHGVKQDGNAPKSPRGHSSLVGALDTIIVCERSASGDIVRVSCSKQKDVEEFVPIFLRRVVVDLGTEYGPDGEEESLSSLVLEVLPEEEQRIRRGVQRAGGLAPGQVKALRALWETFGSRGATHTEWWRVMRERYGYTTSQREGFAKQRQALENRGLIDRSEGSDVIRYVPHPSVPIALMQYEEADEDGSDVE
jgi:hypothetical protein